MQELPVINRVQELYQNVCKLTDKLSSDKKQTIGKRAEKSLLNLLELLIMAKHAPSAQKAPYLIKATVQLEITQLMLRILLEQKLANETTLHQLQAKAVEIGRMLGGWYKSVK